MVLYYLAFLAVLTLKASSYNDTSKANSYSKVTNYTGVNVCSELPRKIFACYYCNGEGQIIGSWQIKSYMYIDTHKHKG
jgi:hypothetical protein